MSSIATRSLILALILSPVANVACWAQAASQEEGQITVRFKEHPPARPHVEVKCHDVSITPPAPVIPVDTTTASPSTAKNNESVKQVQFEFTQDVSAPLLPNQYRLAQNPLEDLQSELNGSDEPDDMGGMFDELNDVSTSLRTDEGAELQTEEADRTAIDSIFGGATSKPRGSDAPQATRRSPLPTLRKNADDRNRLTVPPTARNSGTGLRDDAYYQSLGTPKVPRRTANRSELPMTMGNIFGDEDTYDPACVQNYCRHVWQCAGGRGQTAVSRMLRDLNRSRILQTSQNTGNQLGQNTCKCKKIGANANGQGNSCPGCDQGQPFDGFYDGPYNGQYADPIYYDSGSMRNPNSLDGEVYEDLSEIGQIQPLPTPALPPIP